MNMNAIALDDKFLNNITGGTWYDIKQWTNPANVTFIAEKNSVQEVRNWGFFTKGYRVAETVIGRCFVGGQYLYIDLYRVVPLDDPDSNGKWINRNDIEIPGT